MKTHGLWQEFKFYLKQRKDLLFAQFLNNKQKKMENYFHETKSFFVVKTHKHFIHTYRSWEKGWIQSNLNIPTDLVRTKGQERVLFPQTETCMSLKHLCSTKGIHTPKKPFKSKKTQKTTNSNPKQNPTEAKGDLQMSQYSEKLFHFVVTCTFQKKSHGSEKSENKQLKQACQVFTYVKYN